MLRLMVGILMLSPALVLSAEETMDKKAGESADLVAVIQTDRGDIRLQLFPKEAPLTVANFVNLAQRGYYDGLKFHRVIPNFMIQGGDPMGTGAGGPGYKFKDEFSPKLRHDSAGILSMANAGPGTNGSQFFITHNATPHLNDRHSVFGKVTAGQEVVDAIVKNDKMNKIIIEGDPSGLLAKHKEQIDKWNKLLGEAKGKDAKKGEALADFIKKTEEETGKKFAKTDSGLMYIILQEGTGDSPKPTDEVEVHYTGWLLDGTKFDSSVDRGQPLTHPLKRFVPGWAEGVEMMKVGGKRKLVIPPELGYGARGAGKRIPPNSVLVFDIELLSIK